MCVPPHVSFYFIFTRIGFGLGRPKFITPLVLCLYSNLSVNHNRLCLVSRLEQIRTDLFTRYFPVGETGGCQAWGVTVPLLVCWTWKVLPCLQSLSILLRPYSYPSPSPLFFPRPPPPFLPSPPPLSLGSASLTAKCSSAVFEPHAWRIKSWLRASWWALPINASGARSKAKQAF